MKNFARFCATAALVLGLAGTARAEGTTTTYNLTATTTAAQLIPTLASIPSSVERTVISIVRDDQDTVSVYCGFSSTVTPATATIVLNATTPTWTVNRPIHGWVPGKEPVYCVTAASGTAYVSAVVR